MYLDWLNGNLALAEKYPGPLRFRLRQVLLYKLQERAGKLNVFLSRQFDMKAANEMKTGKTGNEIISCDYVAKWQNQHKK